MCYEKITIYTITNYTIYWIWTDWEKTYSYSSYSGDMGYSLDITSDSGFIVTGYTVDSVYYTQTF